MCTCLTAVVLLAMYFHANEPGPELRVKETKSATMKIFRICFCFLFKVVGDSPAYVQKCFIF